MVAFSSDSLFVNEASEDVISYRAAVKPKSIGHSGLRAKLARNVTPYFCRNYRIQIKAYETTLKRGPLHLDKHSFNLNFFKFFVYSFLQ